MWAHLVGERVKPAQVVEHIVHNLQGRWKLVKGRVPAHGQLCSSRKLGCARGGTCHTTAHMAVPVITAHQAGKTNVGKRAAHQRGHQVDHRDGNNHGLVGAQRSACDAARAGGVVASAGRLTIWASAEAAAVSTRGHRKLCATAISEAPGVSTTCGALAPLTVQH